MKKSRFTEVQIINILKDIIEKKALKLCERKVLVENVLNEENISVNRACQIVCMTRSMYYYKSLRDDQEVIDKLQNLADRYPTRGFETYFVK